MPQFNKYFVRYVPHDKTIDYCLLFALYDLAEYNDKDKLYNKICYVSQQKLAERLNVSRNIVSKIFNNAMYQEHLDINQKEKTIIIKNKIDKGQNVRFVILSIDEVRLIKEINQRKFERYLIYTKYYCGYTKNNTDFTSGQFLREFGYSEKQIRDCCI